MELSISHGPVQKSTGICNINPPGFGFILKKRVFVSSWSCDMNPEIIKSSTFNVERGTFISHSFLSRVYTAKARILFFVPVRYKPSQCGTFEMNPHLKPKFYIAMWKFHIDARKFHIETCDENVVQ